VRQHHRSQLQPARPLIESRTFMQPQPDINGLAALAICESLLLALNDRNILPEREIVGILRDAAAAHKDPPPSTYDPATHEAVAALINLIIDGGNSVRRR
jgi:hypothetical protein